MQGELPLGRGGGRGQKKGETQGRNVKRNLCIFCKTFQFVFLGQVLGARSGPPAGALRRPRDLPAGAPAVQGQPVAAQGAADGGDGRGQADEGGGGGGEEKEGGGDGMFRRTGCETVAKIQILNSAFLDPHRRPTGGRF